MAMVVFPFVFSLVSVRRKGTPYGVGVGCAFIAHLGLVFLVVLNDFSDDEVQELLGEFGVQIGLARQSFEPRDLGCLSGGIAWRKVVCGLEFPHGLRVFEPLAQCIDEDGIKAVDAAAVLGQHVRGFGDNISQAPILSV